MVEKQTIEWKSSWHDDWLKWICGYANAQGGTLYIGKDDDGKVVGVKNIKKLSEDIPNKIRNYLGIVPEVNILDENELDFIEIVVDPYPSPISYHGRYYYRSGSVKSELTGAALDAFLLKKMGKTWDSLPVPGYSISDLKGDAIKLFRKKAIQSGRLTQGELDVSDEVLFQNLRLIENGQLITAAVMMFHDDPEIWANSAYIKIGYFEKSDSDLIYQDEIHGPLIEQVDKAIDLIYTKYLKALIWYDDIQRVETFMFPRDGCRELVLNAVQHKNYQRPVPIQISVYPDKMYIYNIGEMPAEITPAERLFTKHPSLPRNPNIATAFFRSGMVESWGRGYDKIIEACKEDEAALPIVEADFGGLMVRIEESQKFRELRLEHSNVSQDATEKVAEVAEKVAEVAEVAENLTEAEAAVLNLLFDNPSYTTTEMGELLGITRQAVSKRLRGLKNKNVIERVGSDTKGQWEIVSLDSK